MKKTWVKIVSVACVAALILAFSSCKNDSGDDKTTTGTTGTSDVSTTVEDTTVAPVTDANGSTVAPPSTTAGNGATTKAGEATPGGVAKKPANVGEAVAFYNAAVGKISSTKGTYSRTMDACKILFIDLMTTDPRVPDKFNANNANLSGAKVVSLNANDVASYSVSESGDNYVITFKLKDIKGGISAQKGQGGYMYFIDFAEAKGLVKSIADTLTGGSMKIEVKDKGGVVNLSGGSFTTTINKKTGKMSKATLSFKEHLEASAKAAGIVSGTAKVDGHGTVNYTFG